MRANNDDVKWPDVVGIKTSVEVVARRYSAGIVLKGMRTGARYLHPSALVITMMDVEVGRDDSGVIDDGTEDDEATCSSNKAEKTVDVSSILNIN
eukprot:MONOS_6010.1-p1 / transcript=MONOS_6010.1 / gene=MONOS_6010 / organism=Monocercomonoides_exilis_PA203 / gene_product=unspecified product / transcript_product=unspecified product / location=Mono_scaffold00183:33117-33576(-) / protein_length=95 / sequence_SO=supercontig / SO=protein_coding / is_pseudo=false